MSEFNVILNKIIPQQIDEMPMNVGNLIRSIFIHK